MSDTVESPCTGVCTLDDQGYCIGCLRTGHEIAAWPRMAESARRDLLETLVQREKDDVLLER
ncbi:MAG: DUF1289 domain-containing protein [Gammaproteobacteria bacterium]|nr:DUF1289 domain-containing protein [Gammaproteobacteria bacterium]